MVRDARASFDQSLGLLAQAKRIRPDLITKTSLMVGLGETDEEVEATLRRIRTEAEVDLITIGQYLAPSEKHLSVDRFLSQTVSNVGRNKPSMSASSVWRVARSYARHTGRAFFSGASRTPPPPNPCPERSSLLPLASFTPALIVVMEPIRPPTSLRHRLR